METTSTMKKIVCATNNLFYNALWKWLKNKIFRNLTLVFKKNNVCHAKKILSTPSFGGEVKPSVPCRRFRASKRAINVRGSRNLGKITAQFLAHNSTFRC